MPMAQALVMVRHKAEAALDPVLSPMRSPPGPPYDTSLITSSVRKRKPDAPREAAPDEDAKKVRLEAAEPSRRASYGLAQTGPLLRDAGQAGQQHEQQAAAQCDAHSGLHPHDPQQQQHGDGVEAAEYLHVSVHGHAAHNHPSQQQADGMLGTLFSPVFHLLHKEGGGGEGAHPAAAAPLGAPDLATPAPALCPAAPCQLPDSSAAPGGLTVEEVVPLRPHTPPPEPAVDCEPAADCSVRLMSPLASPKAAAWPLAAPAAAAQQQQQRREMQEEDAGPAMAAAAAATEESEEDYELEFDPLLFIKRLPPLEHCVPERRTSFLLPRQTRRSKRKTLVLDLDETLVHSTLDGFCRPDFTFPVEVGNVKHMVSVRQRPHLRTFLERVARQFEVVVFTASQRVYAEQLLNVIDPRRALIRHRVYRESCVFWEGNYLKDLTVLGRDLRDTVIIDNSPQAFGFQLDNGIPIESWYDDDADEELLRLLPFLDSLAGADDVRPHIQAHFKLRQLVERTPDPPPRRCLGGLGALFGC